MIGSPRSVVAPALLAILSLGAPGRASATDGDDQDPSERVLASLQAMRYAGPMPTSAAGLVAAREVTAARLQGGKDYSTAYRTRDGCVVFFSPLEQGQHDLGLSWDGSRCDGQPVKGEGTLTIGYTFDAPGGGLLRLFVFRGRFENGMLSGKGEKANFSFDARGARKESIYAFEGDFAQGLLHGVGRKTWTGPVTGEPSTTVEEGHFSEGTPAGEITFTQLRPYPGVEAETKTLRYDPNGHAFLEQPDSRGAIYLVGEKTGWITRVKTLGDDGKVRAAILFRGRSRSGGFDQSAGCMAWDFRADGLRCHEGILALRPTDSSHRLQLHGRPFMLPIPSRGPSPFRVREQEVLTLALSGKPDEEDTLTCSADLSSCRGKAILPISSQFYFSGQVEYLGGEVRPVSGVFQEGTSIWTHLPAKDETLAACTEFRSPTRCRSGFLKRGGEASWRGGFEIDGLEFEARRGYRPGRTGLRFSMEGAGRFRWKEDGEWADVTTVEDRIVAVGRCGHETLPGDFTCSLNSAGTVVFERQ